MDYEHCPNCDKFVSDLDWKDKEIAKLKANIELIRELHADPRWRHCDLIDLSKPLSPKLVCDRQLEEIAQLKANLEATSEEASELRFELEAANAENIEHIAFISLMKNRMLQHGDNVGLAKIKDHLEVVCSKTEVDEEEENASSDN